LIAAADADTGRSRLRSAAVIRLLLHNALRVDEALGADIADLGIDRGHQVLTVLGKGNRRAKVALTPGTLTALHAYLDDRAARSPRGPRGRRNGPARGTHRHPAGKHRWAGRT
jgi:integrase/recombinase XerD